MALVLMGIRYRDEILQYHVILHMNVNSGLFQNDNARICFAHVSRDTTHLLHFNPIEHLWDTLDQHVHWGNPPPQSLRNILQRCGRAGRTLLSLLCNG